MPRGKRPSLAAFDGKTLPRSKDGRPAPAPPSGGVGGPRNIDNEPPSGIVLRPEVLCSVPRIAISRDRLLTLPLDHRTGFIVSFVDGAYTIEMILDACAMARDEALAILAELAAQGIIVVDPSD
jgi:hypothetical protein